MPWDSNTLAVTIMLAAGFAFAFANYRSRRPYEPGPGFRVPYLAIQFIAVLVLVGSLGFFMAKLKG
jgi:hypothetical protein